MRDLEEARKILQHDSKQLNRVQNHFVSISHISYAPMPPEEYALFQLALHGETNDLALVESYLTHESLQVRIMAEHAKQGILNRVCLDNPIIPSVEIASVTFHEDVPKSRQATAEVVFINTGLVPASVTNIWLGNASLGVLQHDSDLSPSNSLKASRSLAGQAGEIAQSWGFVPSQLIPPGRYAAFRISFDHVAVASRELRFGITGGESVKAFLPNKPFLQHHPISAFAFASKSKAIISYVGHVGLTDLRINGVDQPFILLRPSKTGKYTAALFPLTSAPTIDDALFTELDFDDGEKTSTIVFPQQGKIPEAAHDLPDEAISVLRSRLETSIPISHVETESHSVSEAWVGDSGILLFVRAAAPGPIRVIYDPPPWLKPVRVEDPLDTSAKPPSAIFQEGKLVITLDFAKPVRLVWIANAK